MHVSHIQCQVTILVSHSYKYTYARSKQVVQVSVLCQVWVLCSKLSNRHILFGSNRYMSSYVGTSHVMLCVMI